ncbi:hypothetical protein [Serratia liquefaciens]|uniref:hypothetical protein n=1 Tax=Serratia liquefaciens TaxID=614 RepID=UPI0022DD8D0F|nr:hypothetical protein [Serratia liquefaciens]WBL73684.1 hypothetical protein LQ945_05080 [Serratia liquefaciens]
MKKRYYSLLFATRGLSESDVLEDFGNVVRFINMKISSRGFAGNKGLTNDFFNSLKEFVWIFESKEKRDIALLRLKRLLRNNLLHTMKIKTSMSPSWVTRCNSIRAPQLTLNLQRVWKQRLSTVKGASLILAS